VHRRGRADHDQVGRLLQRFDDLAAQVVRARQFVAVAEDRREAFGDGAGRGDLPDQPFRHRISFQRLVQPVGPSFVLVAVADEGVIPERGCN
jgi:hypothetical protein